MRKRNLISISDLNKDEILEIFEFANHGQSLFKQYEKLLDGYILGSLFFESSTRTQFSFQSAFLRLGGNYIGCSHIEQTRCGPPYFESMEDFGKIISNYCDIIALRTTDEQDIYTLDNNVSVPIISAGHGNAEHPTQALIDLFMIAKLFGRIDGQNILIIGNPQRRVVNSLLLGLNMWSNIHVCILCENEVDLKPIIKQQLDNLTIDLYNSWDELIKCQNLGDISTIYVGEIINNGGLINEYTLKIEMLYNHFSKGVQILSPLPRTNELSKCVDNHSGAKYFLQAQLGLYVRAGLYLKYFI